MPSALGSEEAVNRKTHARVVSSLSSVKTPLFSHVNASTFIPVRRERRFASEIVSGIVVSRQQAEQPIGTHGSCLTIGDSNRYSLLNIGAKPEWNRSFQRGKSAGASLCEKRSTAPFSRTMNLPKFHFMSSAPFSSRTLQSSTYNG